MEKRLRSRRASIGLIDRVVLRGSSFETTVLTRVSDRQLAGGYRAAPGHH